MLALLFMFVLTFSMSDQNPPDQRPPATDQQQEYSVQLKPLEEMVELATATVIDIENNSSAPKALAPFKRIIGPICEDISSQMGALGQFVTSFCVKMDKSDDFVDFFVKFFTNEMPKVEKEDIDGQIAGSAILNGEAQKIGARIWGIFAEMAKMAPKLNESLPKMAVATETIAAGRRRRRKRMVPVIAATAMTGHSVSGGGGGGGGVDLEGQQGENATKDHRWFKCLPTWLDRIIKLCTVLLFFGGFFAFIIWGAFSGKKHD